MSEKRRDSKGRILRVGEQQRNNGQYMFTYRGKDGKNHYVYSWKLEPTDKLPEGKRSEKSLRELEKEIEKSLNEELAYHGGDVTVSELVQRYVSVKSNNVRHNTLAGYKTVLNLLEKEEFGNMRIDMVRQSDTKLWLQKLQTEDKKSFSAIASIRGVLRPAFRMAVVDDLIRKNPFDWELREVIYNDSKPGVAISQRQERLFLEFVKNDKHYCQYYEGIYILFKTGMRVSEFCGLTLNDVDMKNRKIRIDHQLQRTREGEYIIEKPKTKNGERSIPMTEDVYQCFKELIHKRKKIKVEPMIDGISGFLIFDKNNMPCLALHWENYFKDALGKYNRTYKEELPTITPYMCRHTYCTNRVRDGVSPKTLQYLMGHADIQTTLQYYTHYEYEDVEKEIRELEEKMKRAR